MRSTCGIREQGLRWCTSSSKGQVFLVYKHFAKPPFAASNWFSEMPPQSLRPGVGLGGLSLELQSVVLLCESIGGSFFCISGRDESESAGTTSFLTLVLTTTPAWNLLLEIGDHIPVTWLQIAGQPMTDRQKETKGCLKQPSEHVQSSS